MRVLICSLMALMTAGVCAAQGKARELVHPPQLSLVDEAARRVAAGAV